MKSSCIFLFVLIFWTTEGGGTSVVNKVEQKFMCYYGTWANYRPGNGAFKVEDIDPFLCTHVIYTFIGLLPTGEVRLIDPWLDLPDGLDAMTRFNNLRKINPKLKTIIAVGGWNEGSETYSLVMNDPALRATFVKSATAFVLKYNFNGLDLDWEYPGQRDSENPKDKDAYVAVLRDLRQVFDPLGLILSSAVGSIEFSAKISYNIPQVAQYLDIINIMAYDIGGPWDNLTAHNSPLYASSRDVTEEQRTFNLDASIKYWINQGAPREKITVGLALYGHTFVLADPSKILPGSPATGYGEAGQYGKQAGTIGYNEYCEQLQQGVPWKKYWDAEQFVPYAVKGNQWFSYDDLDSIKIKAEYIRDMGLGGAMVWSIESDDFRGLCHGVKYPLLRQIKESMSGEPAATVLPPVTALPPATPPKPELSTASSINPSPKKIMCYYGTWANYRQGNGAFKVEDIDPYLCTHVIYTFIGLLPTGEVRLIDPWLDLPDGLDAMNRFNNLRQINPALKTIIAIGGWNEGSYNYSLVMNNPTLRAVFVKSVTGFVLKYNFDGFDLDWEYPGQRDSTNLNDKEAYVQVLKELRAVFDPLGLLLTSAVGAIEFSAKISYDIPEVSKYLDIINVMAYDIGGPWETFLGHNAPLYPSSRDVTEDQRTFNLYAGINYWLTQGAPKEKITVGLALYGHSFNMVDPARHLPGDPADGYGEPGQYGNQTGSIGYNEFCEQQLNGSPWTTYWDSEQLVPYATKGNQWFSYDNIESIKIKAEYIRDMGLGGAMVWSLETDDFRGLCHGVKYPLLRQIKESVNGIPNPPPTPPPTLAPTTTTPTTTTPTTTTPTTTTPTTTTPTTTTPTTTTPTTTTPTTTTPTTTTPTTTTPTTTTPTTTMPTTTTPTTTTTRPTTTTPTTTRPTTTTPTTTRPTTTTPPATTTRPTTTSVPTSARPTTQDPGAGFTCVEEGIFPDPISCNAFYMCVDARLGYFNMYRFVCPEDLHYDASIKQCNWPELVKCTSGQRRNIFV